MVFSSLLFVFFFLAIHMAVYYFIQPRYRNLVLLVSSLIFYAWGGPRYLLLLVFETFVAWGAGVMLSRCDTETRKGQRDHKLYVFGGCAILLLLLGIFKYLGFFCDTFDFIIPALADVPRLVLPIGISFYTFQLISYIIDVTAGRLRRSRYTGSCFYMPAFFISASPVLLSGMRRSRTKLKNVMSI